MSTALLDNEINIVPVWRSVVLVRGLLDRTLDQDLTVLPTHHPQIDGLGTVPLDILVDAKST
jgi:hypothetical protein